MSDFKIKTVTAFVAIDENDGDEGVMAFFDGAGWMPLICADEARIQSMLPLAKDVCRRSRKKFRIIQFTTREDVTEKYINGKEEN
jgi:hypothetical protein